jgi:ribulose-phosphate 3-epimerase
MKIPCISPSILSADFSRLGDAIRQIEAGTGGFVHIDVMDGSFVPEISYGQPVVRALRPLTALPFDVHLMTEHPENKIESFAEAGADILTFHVENTVHHHRIIQVIHDLGKKAGIALVPSTPVAAVSEILPYIDLVLVMSVNPGYGGQQFIHLCVEKIKQLSDIQKTGGNNFLISVDGGVNEQNVSHIIAAGANIIVAGSAFFSGTLKWEDVK